MLRWIRVLNTKVDSLLHNLDAVILKSVMTALKLKLRSISLKTKIMDIKMKLQRLIM